ncbi:MAG: ankyrin repeat domain-containing protein [bacterium]
MKLKSILLASTIVSSLLILVLSVKCSAQAPQPDTTASNYRIVKATERGDVALFSKLLASDPALIGTREPTMDEPLMVFAARNNQPEIIALLLNKGADINAANRLGSNPLHLAAFTGNYELMEMLMKNGVNWQVKNLRGKAPVHYVSYGKNPQVFTLFLERDKNILSEKTDEGATLLHLAANAGDTAGFSYLLARGLDMKAEDNMGANVMHWAMSGGSKTMLEYLQNKGLDYKFRSSRGYWPVMSAMMFKKQSSVEFILENGAGINDRLPPENFTLFMLACLNDAPEIARYLADHGADINAQETNGFTAIFWTVMNGNREMTRFLLSRGADVNHRTNEGLTPLLAAVDGDSLGMVILLADHGANLMASDAEGKTALHKATIRGSLPFVTYLLVNGLPVNAKDKSGMTALHFAAINGQSAIGKILLEKGADPAITDNLKHNAVWYSERYGNSAMSDLLAKKQGKNPGGTTGEKALSGNLKEGQAIVHYLNHSGYAIETSRHLLVFDYYSTGGPPDAPSLLNGRINPDELKGKKVIVFASHEHGDHYDTVIWRWRIRNPEFTYVMGFRPNGNNRYEYVEPHKEKTIEGVRIHTIRSTDSGAGFLAETDGVVIYHPGDHVNKSGDLSAEYKSEIDYLAGLKKKVDIAFFPVTGCGFPDMEAVKSGNFYAIKELKPGTCFAMHAETAECAAFADEISRKYPEIRTGYGTYHGDRFAYPAKE